MHKKFEVNWTKIKGGCQSERKVSQLNSYSKMPLKTSGFLNDFSIPSKLLIVLHPLSILANSNRNVCKKTLNQLLLGKYPII